MKSIDLNSDIGEGFGHYSSANDEDIIKLITSANIACGWHAGDPLIMKKTVELASRHNVQIGAHPSYPDLLGFGRRNMSISPKEAKLYVQYQLGALIAIALSKNQKVSHLKPHGAMYNMASKDRSLSLAIAQAVYEVDKNIILVGQSGSQLVLAGKETGLRVAHEVFADRAYNSDGTLVSRNLPNSVIHNSKDVIDRMLNLIMKGTITSIDGHKINLQADTICVHSDTDSARTLIECLRKEIIRNSVRITKLSDFIN